MISSFFIVVVHGYVGYLLPRGKIHWVRRHSWLKLGNILKLKTPLVIFIIDLFCFFPFKILCVLFISMYNIYIYIVFFHLHAYQKRLKHRLVTNPPRKVERMFQFNKALIYVWTPGPRGTVNSNSAMSMKSPSDRRLWSIPNQGPRRDRSHTLFEGMNLRRP